MKKFIVCFLGLLFASFAYATPKLEKLTVILDWFPNPDHAPLIVAQQEGFFQEQGLAVKLIGPADPNDPPKWIATKKAEIGITYEPQFMQQIDADLPLVTFGTLIDKPLNCLVTLKSSNIKNIIDLKNKKVGTTGGGLSHIMLGEMLRKHNLSLKDIELITVKYNLTQALLSKNVDAVTGLNRNVEVPQLEATGHSVQTFFPEEYGIPNYSELIFITHTSMINDTRLPRFLAALKKAVAYLDTHAEKSWHDFAKLYPESNNQINKTTWFDTIPYFAEDPARIRKHEWQAFATFLAQHKYINSAKPISVYLRELPPAKPITPKT